MVSLSLEHSSPTPTPIIHEWPSAYFPHFLFSFAKTKLNLIFGNELSTIACSCGTRGSGCRLELQYGTYLGVIKQVFLVLLLWDTWVCHAVTLSDKLYVKERRGYGLYECQNISNVSQCLLESRRILESIKALSSKLQISVLCLLHLYVQLPCIWKNHDGMLDNRHFETF